MNVKIEESWGQLLANEFDKPYFKRLAEQLHAEKDAGVTIYPPGSQIFNAFKLCPLDKLKVVIIGQDPYHGPGQAMGLSFSVPNGVKIPGSLRNIFKEIQSDLGIKMSGRTDLSPWAEQGVLLLNSILTVRAAEPTSHAAIGWQTLTDFTIKAISDNCEGIVFMLWGNYARLKSELIDSSRHLVLQAAHPSPLARGAFFGCRHFSKANEYLISRALSPIDWQL